VGSVAKRRVVSALAATEKHFALCFLSVLDWGKNTPTMGPITIGLAFGLTAGTPVIVSRFKHDDIGLLLR
jgi:hypothetical protein